MLYPAERKSDQSKRRGTATVEFAVVAVFLMTLMLGVIEITRAIQVKNTLADTARSACRVGTQPGSTSQQVTDNVNAILTSNGINSSLATITIRVISDNGTHSDVSKAVKGDQISVQVAVSVAAVSWTTPLFFANAAVTSEAVVMMHQ